MSRLYTADHEWIEIDATNNTIATVGITDHAQDALGDVVFIELPVVGKSYLQKSVAGVVESVKAAADVYMPLSGEIIEVNSMLTDDPAMINRDPESAAWLFKIRLSQPSEINSLLSVDDYQKIT